LIVVALAVTDLPISANFLRFKPDRPIKIPIQYINEEDSPGLKRGGYVNIIKRDIMCISSTNSLPASLEADLTNLNVGDKLDGTVIRWPENITPVARYHKPGMPGLSKEEVLVATIHGRRSLTRGEDGEEIGEE
jgi:large subunit ribosomal protein L25